MALDAFLELIKNGQPVAGETLDKIFGAKKAIAISGFSMETKEKEIEDTAGPQLDTAPTPIGQGTPSIRPSSRPQSDAPAKKECPVSFSIDKEVDASSTELYLGYCRNADQMTNPPYDTAKVTIRKAGGPNPLVYLVLEFSRVQISSYSVNTSSDKPPKEKVKFTCRAVKMQYRPQKSTTGFGSAKITGWDFDLEIDIQE
jgi:type VI protein secretion system component Hcp